MAVVFFFFFFRMGFSECCLIYSYQVTFSSSYWKYNKIAGTKITLAILTVLQVVNNHQWLVTKQRECGIKSSDWVWVRMYSEIRFKLFVFSVRLKAQIWLTNHSSVVRSSVTENMTRELGASPGSTLELDFSASIPDLPKQSL